MDSPTREAMESKLQINADNADDSQQDRKDREEKTKCVHLRLVFSFAFFVPFCGYSGFVFAVLAGDIYGSLWNSVA